MERDLHLVEGEIRAFSEDVEETRAVQFVISSGARDRKGTRMNMKNWKLENFNRNGVIGYQHNLYGDMCNAPDPDDVIGTGRAWVEGDQLIGEVRFEAADINPKAEKIFRKVLAGTLRAASVGILPLKDDKGERGTYGEGPEAKGGPQETFVFHGQELIEFSIVNIPANPDAVRRGLRDQTAHALMYVRRMTGLEFRDIERLTIRDVLDALDGKFGDLENIRALSDSTEQVPREPAAEVLETAYADPLWEYTFQQRKAELGL